MWDIGTKIASGAKSKILSEAKGPPCTPPVLYREVAASSSAPRNLRTFLEGTQRLISRVSGRRSALLRLVLLLFTAAPEVRADLAHHFGLSPRAIGMGNAVSAIIDDYAAVYYNPAGLALTSSNGFTLGYFYSTPRIRTRVAGGQERLSFQEEMKAGVVGYRQNLSSIFSDKWGKNVVVGLALAYPGDFKTATLVGTRFYDEMQFPVFGRVPEMLVMSGGLGIELHKMFLVGVGMRYAVTDSAKDITVHLQLPDRDDIIKKIDIQAETETQPIVGAVFRPWDALRLAAVWRRGGAPVRVVGKGGGRALVGPLEIPIDLSLNFQDFFTPDEFAGAVAWSPSEMFLLAFELTYAKWSHYDDPYGLSPPGDPFEDILIPRFGVEIDPPGPFRFQVGYYWQPSPVKDVQPFTQYLDTEEHVFSCAVEYELPIKRLLEYPLRFHAFFQYQHMPRRTLETVNGATAIWGYITHLGATVQLSF